LFSASRPLINANDWFHTCLQTTDRSTAPLGTVRPIRP